MEIIYVKTEQCLAADSDLPIILLDKEPGGGRLAVGLAPLTSAQRAAAKLEYTHGVEVSEGALRGYVGYWRYEKGEPAQGKALDVTSSTDFPNKVPDIVTHGDPDTWKLICKASSVAGGWMKSTKAMLIPGFGVLIQVSTYQDRNVAEAVTPVPGASLERLAGGVYGIITPTRAVHVGKLRNEDGSWNYGD